jgi:hypothetical protein
MHRKEVTKEQKEDHTMFVRIKKSGKHKYLQIVRNYRIWRRVKQKVVASLGNLDTYTTGMTLLDIGYSFIELHEKLHPAQKVRKKRKKAT